MSTKKRRIATYIPTEIEDKFQAFKRERSVGDSQALILILTEFLGVSQKVAHLGDSLVKVKSELLSELKSELSKEAEKLEAELNKRIGELRSELLNKPLPEIKIENVGKPSEQQKLSIPIVEVTDSDVKTKGLSAKKLAEILAFDNSGLGKKAKNLSKEEFADWSRGRNSEGVAWEQREDKKYYPLPESLSEEAAEAQSSHP